MLSNFATKFNTTQGPEKNHIRTYLLNIIVQCTTSEHIFRIDRTIVVIDVIEYNRHQYILRMCITPIVIIEELSKNNGSLTIIKIPFLPIIIPIILLEVLIRNV